MHARHYSPALGRFLQPDPDRSEANLYSYAANNPVTEIDPDGTCFIVCQIAIGAAIDAVVYLTSTPNANLGGLARAVVGGAVESAVNPLAKVNKVFKLAKAASKVLTKVPKATRTAKRVVQRVHGGTRRMFDRSRASQAGQIRVPDVKRVAAAARARAASAATRLKQIEWRGGEIRFSKGFRIKPFPTPFARDARGKLRAWQNRLPHYHRRGPGGIDRHRPWDTRAGDKSWRDRF